MDCYSILYICLQITAVLKYISGFTDWCYCFVSLNKFHSQYFIIIYFESVFLLLHANTLSIGGQVSTNSNDQCPES